VIVLLNGAFGVGKTTVARLMVARLPRAILFDPELIGFFLQRVTRVEDFQDLRSWRRLTILGLRMTRMFFPNVIVPMAMSNPAYLDELRAGIARFEPRVLHYCLIAPLEVIHERLQSRRVDVRDAAWQHRRAAECCAVHAGPEFAIHIATQDRDAAAIADELVGYTRASAHPAGDSRGH